MPDYTYTPTIQHSGDTTPYRLLTTDGVRVEQFNGKDVLVVEAEALERLAYEAFADVSFFLRPGHMQQVAKILDDPEASENDLFVARCFLENSVIAAIGELPTCQDTGTAIVVGTKGAQVWTDFDEKEAFSNGVYRCFQEFNLRYSQIAPLDMFSEKNTGNNLPAQVDIYAGKGDEYELMFVAKGGGSANKSYLFQKTKALLTEDGLTEFLKAELFNIGTAACPPYHFAVVIGGTSAEATMKYVKLASTGALDDLPTTGDASGRAFRDLEWEEKILQMAQNSKIGAQFGGKYFCHDVRVVRMPRHAASCPVGLGVSCSADRNIKAKITRDGVFLEQLEHDPAKYAPANLGKLEDEAPVIDLNRPMEEILADLSQYSVCTRVRLNGTLIVARDIAHAKIQEMLDRGEPMPDYFKNHPVYYAGPAKCPKGKPSGSFGPTTAQRMDPYVEPFQAHRGSMVMLAKGNRTQAVTDSCTKHGGFYLGSVGGPAALLAEKNILKVEIVDMEELGMEAVRKIEVVDFPAVIIVDDKGHDFFADILQGK
ncbi:FumA C-terminus/TtdB family hydratase beta subunit [Pontiella sulfatireligans]|uniref:Fumarate hydratase class I n=1 Tax=Pontiella sulfatireligans TaxID=2750658 RepID=A0A6C2UNL9_9BACT|nr:FumA C-terminus/TtdB family hydratase beta subunit [Pontiella sulfatireligans]VGO20646.1 Fumarate hydratase class I, aerobic [Pontiella sulfatireligans]